jgi:hypothetical protein
MACVKKKLALLQTYISLKATNFCLEHFSTSRDK